MSARFAHTRACGTEDQSAHFGVGYQEQGAHASTVVILKSPDLLHRDDEDSLAGKDPSPSRARN